MKNVHKFFTSDHDEWLCNHKQSENGKSILNRRGKGVKIIYDPRVKRQAVPSPSPTTKHY